MTKPKVAFICVHNSCRSQIAEALGRALASDVFESYSAGTETKPRINQDAVRLVNELYGIDMEQTQYSKLISAIPEPDFTISMGCNVGCPFIGRPFDDNWGLEDPTGKDDAAFKDVIMQIHQNIIALENRLQTIYISLSRGLAPSSPLSFCKSFPQFFLQAAENDMLSKLFADTARFLW